MKFPKSGYKEKYEVQDKFGYVSYFDLKKSADNFIKKNPGSFYIKKGSAKKIIGSMNKKTSLKRNKKVIEFNNGVANTKLESTSNRLSELTQDTISDLRGLALDKGEVDNLQLNIESIINSISNEISRLKKFESSEFAGDIRKYKTDIEILKEIPIFATVKKNKISASKKIIPPIAHRKKTANKKSMKRKSIHTVEGKVKAYRRKSTVKAHTRLVAGINEVINGLERNYLAVFDWGHDMHTEIFSANSLKQARSRANLYKRISSNKNFKKSRVSVRLYKPITKM